MASALLKTLITFSGLYIRPSCGRGRSAHGDGQPTVGRVGSGQQHSERTSATDRPLAIAPKRRRRPKWRSEEWPHLKESTDQRHRLAARRCCSIGRLAATIGRGDRSRKKLRHPHRRRRVPIIAAHRWCRFLHLRHSARRLITASVFSSNPPTLAVVPCTERRPQLSRANLPLRACYFSAGRRGDNNKSQQ